MFDPVAVRARHPRAFLLIGVHLRFRFRGRPDGAGSARQYQLGLLHRKTRWCATHSGWSGRIPRLGGSASPHCSRNAIHGRNHPANPRFIGPLSENSSQTAVFAGLAMAEAPGNTPRLPHRAAAVGNRIVTLIPQGANLETNRRKGFGRGTRTAGPMA
jgi:hypothetical protein